MAQNNHIIRVVELFAGVGGFRIGLEAAWKERPTLTKQSGTTNGNLLPNIKMPL